MQKRFNLIRTYSLKSLIGIAVVAVALVWFYHVVSESNLRSQETNFNVSLAQSLSETIWPQYADFIAHAKSIPLEQLPKMCRKSLRLNEISPTKCVACESSR